MRADVALILLLFVSPHALPHGRATDFTLTDGRGLALRGVEVAGDDYREVIRAEVFSYGRVDLFRRDGAYQFGVAVDVVEAEAVELRVPERGREPRVRRERDLERPDGRTLLVLKLFGAYALLDVLAQHLERRVYRAPDVRRVDRDRDVPRPGRERRRAEARRDAVGQAFNVSHLKSQTRRQCRLAERAVREHGRVVVRRVAPKRRGRAQQHVDVRLVLDDDELAARALARRRVVNIYVDALRPLEPFERPAHDAQSVARAHVAGRRENQRAP